MSVIITGVAYYEVRDDDIELLHSELGCDHIHVDTGEEFSLCEDRLQELLPKEPGFYAVAFNLEVDYHKCYDHYSGVYEYDASYDLLWHRIRALVPNEIQSLLSMVGADPEAYQEPAEEPFLFSKTDQENDQMALAKAEIV